MQSHYAITCTIRYFKPPCDVDLLPGLHPRLRVTPFGTPGQKAFDVSRWKDAPHLALANLRDEPEAVLRFTRTYGVPRQGQNRRPRKAGTVPVRDVLDLRDFLRRAWEGDTDNFFAVAFGETSLLVQPTWMGLFVDDPWTLVLIMFARDWAEKRIKKCENPECPAPYFCAVRRGQKFCSQKCAVLINVRQFRAREADLKEKGEKYAKAKKA